MNNVTFCIQTLRHDNSGFSLPSPDSAVLLEVIDEHNWLHPEDPIAAMLSSSCANIFQDGEQLIPVGSIEFVESGLRRWYGIERGLTPLFIPEPLRPFAHRWVQVTHGKQQAESALADLGKAFIKSASAVKCDYAGHAAGGAGGGVRVPGAARCPLAGAAAARGGAPCLPAAQNDAHAADMPRADDRLAARHGRPRRP